MDDLADLLNRLEASATKAQGRQPLSSSEGLSSPNLDESKAEQDLIAARMAVERDAPDRSPIKPSATKAVLTEFSNPQSREFPSNTSEAQIRPSRLITEGQSRVFAQSATPRRVRIPRVSNPERSLKADVSERSGTQREFATNKFAEVTTSETIVSLSMSYGSLRQEVDHLAQASKSYAAQLEQLSFALKWVKVSVLGIVGVITLLASVHAIWASIFGAIHK